MRWMSKLFKRKEKKGAKIKIEKSNKPAPYYIHESTPEREEKLLDWTADQIIKYDMGMPAIIFLYAQKPVSLIEFQMMWAFSSPFLDFLGLEAGSDLMRILERRENIDRLISKIEDRDPKLRQKRRL